MRALTVDKKYRHHAFISYAWADDQSFDTAGGPDQHGSNRGWVSTFCDRYGKHLGREIGRIPEGERIWLDYEQLRGNDLVTPRISDGLKESALLIPILSNAWFASPWCRQEFTTFTEHYPNWQDRLFPVWMNPVEPDDLDEEGQQIWDQLRELLGYQFWYRDQANEICTRWFPDPDPADRDYSKLQQNMARDMFKRLKQLAEGKSSPEPTTPSRNQPSTPCNPPVPPFKGHHLVVINGGSSDSSLVRDVACTLAGCEGLGHMVPLMAQYRDSEYKPSELLRDLRKNLELATAILMVVDKGPPHQINEQVREYLQAAAKRPERTLPLEVCHLGGQPLGFHVPGMRVHRVTDGNVVDCACNFARGLQA